MKLLHSLALMTVFVLIAQAAVPSQAAISWGWGSSSKDDKKDEPKKAELTAQKDEEQANDVLDEEDYKDDVVANNKPLEPNQQNFRAQGTEEKTKIQIVEDDGLTESIKTIDHLPQPNEPVALNQSSVYAYGQPQQSEFVDPAAHPTVSQGADPRFARPHQCQDGQYLCRKASPQQEHIRCIPNEWKCNGVRDCEENDDEDGCNINVHRPAPFSCQSPTQYTCYGTGINGIPAQCIDIRRLCNGVYDCQYGDDESQDRCTQYATRREETIQPNPNGQAPPVEQPVQAAPQYPYPTNNGQQPQPEPQPQQPQPQAPRAPEPQQCAQTSKSEEYVKRLEWIDRCFRTCLKYN